jgi:hypothetical protein
MVQHWLDWAGYLDLAAIIALIVSLSVNRLYRVYRCFFAYMAADALEGIAALTFFSQNHRKNLYAYLYLAGQFIKLILAVFVVLELYRVALQGHPALAKFGRNTVAYLLTAAAAVAAAGLMLDRYVPPGHSLILSRFYSFERTMNAWLLIFLIVISLFMTWFPVRLKRNSVLYIAGFVIYFLSRSAGLLLINLYPPQSEPLINTVMISIASACLLMWLAGLKAAGEETTTVVGHRWDPTATGRLLGQLDAINARLVRFSRR